MMGLEESTQSQLWLSLLAFAVVLALYAVTKWRGGSVERDFDAALVRGRDPGARAGQRDRRRVRTAR